MVKLTLYMKSGNVIVLKKVATWKLEKKPGQITTFTWTLDGKTNMPFLNVDQIEAVMEET